MYRGGGLDAACCSDNITLEDPAIFLSGLEEVTNTKTHAQTQARARTHTQKYVENFETFDRS